MPNLIERILTYPRRKAPAREIPASDYFARLEPIDAEHVKEFLTGLEKCVRDAKLRVVILGVGSTTYSDKFFTERGMEFNYRDIDLRVLAVDLFSRDNANRFVKDFVTAAYPDSVRTEPFLITSNRFNGDFITYAHREHISVQFPDNSGKPLHVLLVAQKIYEISGGSNNPDRLANEHLAYERMYNNAFCVLREIGYSSIKPPKPSLS